MKKVHKIVIAAFTLLLSFSGSGQTSPTLSQLVDAIKFRTATTTIRDLYVVPVNQVWLIYNTTNSTFEYWNGASWVELGTGGGGSGNVTKVGTPVDNQIAIWTGDGTIEGTIGLTYDGTQMEITGNLVATGSLNATNHVSAGGSFVSTPGGLTSISGQAAFGYTDDDEFSLARRFGVAYPNGDANTRAIFNTGELSVNRTFTLPDKDGTFAMLDDVTASNFGIVAQGSAVVGSTATVTVTHGLGFAPAIDRITLTSTAAAGAYNISVGNVTTTQMDIINTNAGTSTVFWKIFGSGNVTPVTEGHVIEDNAVAQTQRANLNFVGATITDDVANDRTTITITGGSGVPDDNSVSTIKIQDDAVTIDKIANDAVGFQQIADSAVEGNHIALGAVSADKIGTGQVTAIKMAANSVSSTNITNGTIQSGDLDPTLLTSLQDDNQDTSEVPTLVQNGVTTANAQTELEKLNSDIAAITFSTDGVDKTTDFTLSDADIAAGILNIITNDSIIVTVDSGLTSTGFVRMIVEGDGFVAVEQGTITTLNGDYKTNSGDGETLSLRVKSSTQASVLDPSRHLAYAPVVPSGGFYTGWDLPSAVVVANPQSQAGGDGTAITSITDETGTVTISVTNMEVNVAASTKKEFDHSPVGPSYAIIPSQVETEFSVGDTFSFAWVQGSVLGGDGETLWAKNDKALGTAENALYTSAGAGAHYMEGYGYGEAVPLGADLVEGDLLVMVADQNGAFNRFRYYVNGVLVHTTEDDSGAAERATGWYIGAQLNGGGFSDLSTGTNQGWGLYNAALTPAEQVTMTTDL